MSEMNMTFSTETLNKMSKQDVIDLMMLSCRYGLLSVEVQVAPAATASSEDRVATAPATSSEVPSSDDWDEEVAKRNTIAKAKARRAAKHNMWLDQVCEERAAYGSATEASVEAQVAPAVAASSEASTATAAAASSEASTAPAAAASSEAPTAPAAAASSEAPTAPWVQVCRKGRGNGTTPAPVSDKAPVLAKPPVSAKAKAKPKCKDCQCDLSAYQVMNGLPRCGDCHNVHQTNVLNKKLRDSAPTKQECASRGCCSKLLFWEKEHGKRFCGDCRQANEAQKALYIRPTRG